MGDFEEQTTGFEDGTGVIDDWAEEIAYVSDNVGDAYEQGSYSVVTPQAGEDYQSFEGMVDAYGDVAAEVAEHYEDGHGVSIETVHAGEVRGITSHSDHYQDPQPHHDYAVDTTTYEQSYPTETSWPSYETTDLEQGEGEGSSW
jgi:hypothetical protein